MKTKEEFYQFQRQVYLNAEPPIDLNDVSVDNPIAPWEHKIKMSVYNRIEAEFTKGHPDIVMAVAFWFLNNGPSGIDDTNEFETIKI